MDITSYLLGKQAGGGTPINNQNKNITVTENGTTTVSADAGYTGLGAVGVTTNVQPDLESKSVTITENGTTTVTPTTGKDGLSEVEVTTNVSGGGDLSEYFDDTIQSGTFNNPGWNNIIKKIPSVTASGTSLENAFRNYPFAEVPVINGTVNVTNMNNMFMACSSLINLDLSYFNTSNVTTMDSMFRLINTQLKSLNISSFNFEKCINISNMFYANGSLLEDLAFGYNLGKGYLTTASADYNNYTLNLSVQNRLTHDSLMSVINGLYDIASAGVQPQKLVLGSTNLAKLTQAEIDIAVNKGWNIS